MHVAEACSALQPWHLKQTNAFSRARTLAWVQAEARSSAQQHACSIYKAATNDCAQQVAAFVRNATSSGTPQGSYASCCANKCPM